MLQMTNTKLVPIIEMEKYSTFYGDSITVISYPHFYDQVRTTMATNAALQEDPDLADHFNFAVAIKTMFLLIKSLQ